MPPARSGPRAPALPRLRSPRRSDVAPLAAWLPATAADAGADGWADGEAIARAVGAPDVLVAGEPDCFLHYELNAPDAASALVRFLAVAPGRRRLGIGHRAVLALERRLRKQAKRCCVVVPARTGLALYFWLRLGYRTLTRHEWPEPPPDAPAIWMARDLD